MPERVQHVGGDRRRLLSARPDASFSEPGRISLAFLIERFRYDLEMPLSATTLLTVVQILSRPGIATDFSGRMIETMKRMCWLAAMVLPLGGCCIISCNGSLPNSYVKVISATDADCTYEDKLGLRTFKAPGVVLGMPRNAPGKLTCQAIGYKPYSKTLTAQDWNPLTPLSGDPDALRYFSEVEMVMEAGAAETGK